LEILSFFINILLVFLLFGNPPHGGLGDVTTGKLAQEKPLFIKLVIKTVFLWKHAKSWFLHAQKIALVHRMHKNAAVLV